MYRDHELRSQVFFIVFVIVAIAASACRKKEDIVSNPAVKPEAVKVQDDNKWMAIVGDSGVTGAVASPRLKPTLDQLGKFIFDDSQSDARREDIPSAEKYGIKEDRPAPLTRILFSKAERQKMNPSEAQAAERATQKLDINQYSWGYLVGRKLGFKPQDIVMVAQDGTRVDSIATQFQRIKDIKGGALPPAILMSFNANDLCDESVLTQPTDQVVAKYEQTIREQMQKALEGATAHANQTKIIAFAPLDVAVVISNPELLSQKIDFQGRGQIECRNLREGNIEGTLTRETRQKLLGMCKAVLDTKPDDAPRIRKISELSQAFATAWERLVRDFNQAYGSRGFHFEYSDSTRQARFQNGDLANECFHPGVKAHVKIADQVLEFLTKIKFQP